MARPLMINDQLMLGGLQRDSAGDSRYQSFRELKNFDIVYDPVALQRRKGWQYYGPTFSEIPQQVWSCKLRSHPDANAAVPLTHYIFVKTQQYIYCFAEGTTDIKNVYDGSSETADWQNNPVPFAHVEFRVFFGTGTGLRWIDTDGIAAGTGATFQSYDATMSAPTAVPYVSRADAYVLYDLRSLATPPVHADINIMPWQENTLDSTDESFRFDLANISANNPSNFVFAGASTSRYAQQFMISEDNNTVINNVSFLMWREGDESGSVKVVLRSDDNNKPGDPVTSIYGSKSESVLYDIKTSLHKIGAYNNSVIMLLKFKFPITVLAKNTKYWFTLEPDSLYMGGSNKTLNLKLIIDVGLYSQDFYTGSYNDSTGAWSVGSSNQASYMFIDGPGGEVGNNTSGYSEYKFATRNIYVDESELTESRQTTLYNNIFHPMVIKSQSMVTSGGNKFAIYRTTNPTGELYDKNTYNFLGVVDTGSDVTDCVLEYDGLTFLTPNNALRSSLKDFDGATVRPTHIIPYAGRLFVVTDDRLISFSERLENEGALGQVGDSLYFSYPAENKIMFREPIKDFYLYNGVLYVFTENGIDLVRGGDSPLNPPPDLLQDSVSSHQGTSVDGCVTEVRGSLLFITSEKIIKAFQGNVPIQSLSSAIQSIVSASTFNPERAAMIGYDYYLGTSTDGAGSFSDIYIFSFDERRMFWKQYSYGIAFKHLHGTVNEMLLAAPATGDNRIIQLETGLLDNDANITSTVETHSVPSPNRSRWTKFELECSYPTATPPPMTVTATAKDGATSTKLIQPTNSNDVRQHSGGLRILSEECRLKIETAGNQADEIRMITLK